MAPVSDDFLTKTEFCQYMGKFETNLENRLTKLESKIVNGKGNEGSKENSAHRGKCSGSFDAGGLHRSLRRNLRHPDFFQLCTK